MRTSLEQRTVRPGSLGSYSFYHSSRRAPVVQRTTPKAPKLPWKQFSVILIIFAAGFLGFVRSSADNATNNDQVQTPAAIAAENRCADNHIAKFIVVSVNERHMWACQGDKKLYDSAVITGMQKHASTETPLGTYKIYAKHQNTVLTGSDETGSWRDPVDYWMPFLDNKYGTYGFHDATWRSNSDFGNVDSKTSDNASHGCVELPLAASKWLYEWADVGTTLKIDS